MLKEHKVTVTAVYETPIPFRGAPEDFEKNFNTHAFTNSWDDDNRCIRCDAGAWMTSATWPCGMDVPRKRTIHLSDGSVVFDHEYLPGKWRSEIESDLDYIKRPAGDDSMLPAGQFYYDDYPNY